MGQGWVADGERTGEGLVVEGPWQVPGQGLFTKGGSLWP